MRWTGKLGNMGAKDLLISVMVLVMVAISAIVFGFIEYEFFTNWNAQQYFGIDAAWVLGHFNGLCIAMLILVTVMVAIPVFVVYMYTGISKSTALIIATAVIGVLLWIMIEDFVANFLYLTLGAQYPVGPNDWNDFGSPAMVIIGGYPFPNWYFVFIGIIIIIFTWMATYRKSRGGLSRTW